MENGPKVVLAVSAFQVGDNAILTVKDGEELVWSGVAPAHHGDGMCDLEIGGGIVHCVVESTNDDPAVVGKVENQRRYFWAGTVVQAATEEVR